MNDFVYYNDCIDGGCLPVIDVREYRKDDAAALCDQAQKMCKAHSCFDSMRDVRVAVHQLMEKIHREFVREG